MSFFSFWPDNNSGDVIAAVNGYDVRRSSNVREVINLIAGPPDTTVTINLTKGGLRGQPFSVTLQREMIRPSAESSSLSGLSAAFLPVESVDVAIHEDPIPTQGQVEESVSEIPMTNVLFYPQNSNEVKQTSPSQLRRAEYSDSVVDSSRPASLTGNWQASPSSARSSVTQIDTARHVVRNLAIEVERGPRSHLRVCGIGQIDGVDMSSFDIGDDIVAVDNSPVYSIQDLSSCDAQHVFVVFRNNENVTISSRAVPSIPVTQWRRTPKSNDVTCFCNSSNPQIGVARSSRSLPPPPPILGESLGISVIIAEKSNAVVIADILPHARGVLSKVFSAGDIIEEIDGLKLAALPRLHESVPKILDGPSGTLCRLRVRRTDNTLSEEIPLIRSTTVSASSRNLLVASRYSGRFDNTSADMCEVGLHLRIIEDNLIVVDIERGSGAAAVGTIMRGDVLLRVNGISVEKQSPDFVSAMLKGAAGTSVDLLLFRPSTRETISVTAMRTPRVPLTPAKAESSFAVL